MPTENRQVLIDSLPEGALSPDDYAVSTGPMPEAGPGQVRCRTLAITIGAGQRAGLQGSASYAGAPVTGIVMGGTGVGIVEESNASDLPVGSVVRAPTGWQEHSVHDASDVQVVDADVDPALHLGVFGTNGMTAYFGLLDVGQPQPGETVLVSAAAGSVGHIVGQIAKVKGCTVVGVAGSDEKCRILVDDLGFDRAANYKADDFRDAFKAATPDGINVYFDNTGGDILGSALRRMAPHGRIVCCGVVSQYDTSNPGPGPRGVPGLLVNNRVRMQGFLVFDYADRMADARAEIGGWIEDGTMTPRQITYDGLEAAPQAFVDLLAGATIGTTIVRVSD